MEDTTTQDKTDIDVKHQALVEGKHALFSCECTVFALDVSGSMSTNKKLSTLKECFRQYIQQKIANSSAEVDQVSIVLFPGEGYVDIPVDEWDTLLGRPSQKADPRYAFRRPYRGCGCDVLFGMQTPNFSMADKFDRVSSHGGTPLGAALIRAETIIDGGGAGLARIIVMSDGQPNSGMTMPDILSKAEMLFKTKGIIVDAVAILCGDHYVSETFMKKLADAGGGQFVAINILSDFSKYLHHVEQERREILGKGVLLLPGDVSG